MKSKILVLTGLLMLFSSSLFSEEAITKNKSLPKSPIIVLSTPELYQLTTRWASEYCSLNPSLEIKVISVKDAKKDNFSEAGANFGFVSSDQANIPDGDQVWKMTVGRNVVIPIINSKNPFKNEILQQGISSEKFAQVFSNKEKRMWDIFLKNGQNDPVHLYISNDESVITVVKKFLNINQIPVDGIIVTSEKELISAIQNDPYAVGFCRMVNIIDSDKQSIIENINLLPIDKNGNGRIDYIENIYDNQDVFARGVWIGKYPKSLFHNILYIAPAQPANETEISFLKWILTDGQQFLLNSGYSGLVISERQAKLDKFINININRPPAKEIYSFPFLTVLILSAIILLSLIISGILVYRRKSKASVSAAHQEFPLAFNEDSLVVPKGLYFDKTHTWAFLEKDGLVKIGIDDFLQHITGPITRIEMKKPGEKIKKGDMVLSIIQKGKQLDICSPVSGTIKEHNKVLITNTSILNSSPYTDGWVYLIEPANWTREIQFLDMAEKYRLWLLNEFTRVKDFLAGSLKVNRIEYEHIVLQDGGVLKDNILEDLGPEVWDDFQTNFLDVYKKS